MQRSRVALLGATMVFLFLPMGIPSLMDTARESPQREWGEVSNPGYLSGQSHLIQIPPTEVGGSFRSSLRDRTPGQGAHSGLDPSNLDTSCKPCDDFDKFANGGWKAKHPVPREQSALNRFNELADRNQQILFQILQRAANASHDAHTSSDGIQQKLGNFYASFMAVTDIEAAGSAPVKPELTRIQQVSDLNDLQVEIAHLHGIGVDAAFNFSSQQDPKNSDEVIGTAGAGGLGLPDRDYYTNAATKSKQIRDEYAKHITAMFRLFGDDLVKAKAEAKSVLSIETRLAQASMTLVQKRDPNATYHKMDLAALKAMTPKFVWPAYFKEVGIPNVQEIDVEEPEFFKELDLRLTSIPIWDWKTYLRWRLMDTAAPALSTRFTDEDFRFNGSILTGAKENRPRWKRAVQAADLYLGDALGKLYVEKAFLPETKARAIKMVQNLIDALRSDLSTIDWMGESTRKQALLKLESFARKIGYPDKWIDYSALKVDRGPYVLNKFRAARFLFDRKMAQIGKPVDRALWDVTAPTVDARYDASNNAVIFPAGVLQPPFFDPKADSAVNYGGIGAAIGHEMTHGFDTEGRQFDAHGNLKDWWSAEDLKRFEARAQCIISQFDGYVVEGDLHENGKLVVGESIADLGGLVLAYRAFEKSMEGKPRPKDVDGFTPEQRFFLGYAQVWAETSRPEYDRLRAGTDPHPLPRFRINGPLSNMPEFAKAWGCRSSDRMVRPEGEGCRIW